MPSFTVSIPFELVDRVSRILSFKEKPSSAVQFALRFLAYTIEHDKLIADEGGFVRDYNEWYEELERKIGHWEHRFKGSEIKL